MDRARETIIAGICLLCLVYLGVAYKEMKKNHDREVYLIFKIDSLKTEIKKLNYESTRTGR